jgi:CRISPR-associated endonuclease Csn1
MSAGQNPERPSYILGLDLGVASIGWAMIECDASPQANFKPTKLLSMGSHLFESGTDGGKAGLEGIARGIDKPRNQKRRTARLMRRQTWRRARRKRVLLRALIEHDLLPRPASLGIEIGAGFNRPLDIDAYIKKIDAEMVSRWRAVGKAVGGPGWTHADEQRLCYLLRAAAANGKVTKHELGRALYHLAQRRGFLSNRRAEAKKGEDESSEVKKDIASLAESIEASGLPVKTLGAYLATLNPDERRLRGRWTGRGMYETEFLAIMNEQSKHYPEILDGVSGLWDEIRQAIFYQRPLKDQKGLIGRCSLIPDERRCPISNRRYQRFRVLQTVNNLRLGPPGEEPKPLTPEQREQLIAALMRNGDLTFPAARKLLGLKKNVQFNLETGDETKIPGNRTEGKLRKVFGERLDSFTSADLDRMVEDLRSFRLPDALVRRGVQRWGLTKEEAEEFASIGLEEGYAPICLAAVARLMPLLEEGTPYATARRALFPEQFEAGMAFDELPPLSCFDDRHDPSKCHSKCCGKRSSISKDLTMIRNPAVTRTLTEARKLVNELVRRFGKPVKIRIELAREIKNPRGIRERISKQNREREKERAAIAALITKEAGIARPTRDDIQRAMLAFECDWQCPYTGKQIHWKDLFGKQPQFDVEHIWPKGRSLDDSFLNKTLCHHEHNRGRKRGHTPVEAYGTEELEQILARVRKFDADPFTKAEKLRRFMEPIDEGFTNKHLSDTRFISRAAADYTALLYGGREEASVEDAPRTRRVEVGTGGLTAWLRMGWGLDSLLGDSPEKNRSDHRHHAIDAVVIALSDSRAVQSLARAATEADRQFKRRAFESIDAPWASIRSDAEEKLRSLIVSHRQSRKVTGPLHDQSIYSRPFGEGKTQASRISKVLADLTVDQVTGGVYLGDAAIAKLVGLVERLGVVVPDDADLKSVILADGFEATTLDVLALRKLWPKLAKHRAKRTSDGTSKRKGGTPPTTAQNVQDFVAQGNARPSIVDTRSLKAIRQRLDELKVRNPSEKDISSVFSLPANAPLVKGHDGAMVRLRKVKVEANAGRRIGRADKATDRYVQPASNHHTVVVATLDAAGNDASWEDHPVQLIDAYARQAAKVPIVDRHVEEGQRFVFSLAPGEFVEMNTPDDATKRTIYRVASISKGDMELRLHTDARTSSELKESKSRVRVSGDKLRELQARKVTVTYLGEVKNAGG